MKDSIWVSFWQKAKAYGDGDCCWLWIGAKTSAGRGNFRGRSAPRVCWELVHGEIKDGLNVLHKCDNPACVRPSHLFLGTQKDNVADMISKGRKVILRNGDHGMSKLGRAAVTDIRRQSAAGIPYAAIAWDYGISKSQVGRIARREQWQ